MNWQLFQEGFLNTLWISTLAGLTGVIVGFALTQVVKGPLHLFLEFIRCTPLVFQVFALYALLPELGIQLSEIWIGVSVLGLHHSAYFCEIFRAGLRAIPRGQWMAGMAQGLSSAQISRWLIWPQVWRVVRPSVISQWSTLFKDSAVLSLISVAELTRAAQSSTAESFDPLPAYALAGGLYLLLFFSFKTLAERYRT